MSVCEWSGMDFLVTEENTVDIFLVVGYSLFFIL